MDSPIKELERRQHEQWKKDNDTFQERMRQNEQARHNRTMQTLERVRASGLSRDGLAVQYLLNASRRGEVDIEEVHMSDLGYEENILKWREINALFEQLKKEGCIKGFQRKANEWIKVDGLNKRRLMKKMKTYHPSQEDPQSTRRTVFEWVSVVAALFAMAGVVGTLYFSFQQNKGNDRIEALQQRVDFLEQRGGSDLEKPANPKTTNTVGDQNQEPPTE